MRTMPTPKAEEHTKGGGKCPTTGTEIDGGPKEDKENSRKYEEEIGTGRNVAPKEDPVGHSTRQSGEEEQFGAENIGGFFEIVQIIFHGQQWQ
jgi:hypothetical protein